MKRRTFLLALSALACLPDRILAAPGSNVLLQPWSGPYGGVPPFGKVHLAEFPPALQESMDQYRAEVEKIAQNTETPTFDNTLAALEGSGRTFIRVANLFWVYTGTMGTKEYQALEREWSPKMQALTDEVVQNGKLFERIEAIYQNRARLQPEQQRLAQVQYDNFVLAGAKLKPAQKQEMARLNIRLTELYTRFSQNQLHDEEQKLVVGTREELAGLPEDVISSAAAGGKWEFPNTRSAMEPILTYADNRALREKAFKFWSSRGDHPGEHDNNPLITEILKLRARKAELLGFPTFAHWRLQNTMAQTPDRAMDLMLKVWPHAVRRAREEVADMSALAGFAIEPWDYRYYAEKVRKAKYDLDEAEIKPYLQLDQLKEGLFWSSGQLYGFEYKKIAGLPIIVPEMQVYEVVRDGRHVGLWYFDPYARKGKRSGAWMSEYRTQESFEQPIAPIVSNNSNFLKAKPGEAVLMSWEDADTMFHEFGHALHGLNSAVHYPTLAGTNVARDYVEFPSQLNEHWLSTPEVLNRFALHVETGKPMPAELVAKIKKASTFNQGFATVEALASAILDMRLHLAGAVPIDPRAFEAKELAALGMPREIIMRHRLPHFGHIFSGEGYAAGYYSYIWSDVLNHDAFQAFTEAGGP
ncbi:MAG: M3 family metallopeptidase, partial [Candidatus Eremiobacterota bacterium]